MCCTKLFNCVLILTTIILLGFVSVKIANSRIDCIVNQYPVIFSITVVPLPSRWSYYVHSKKSFDIFNVQFIHEDYRQGGGQISVLWNTGSYNDIGIL